jgi:hypothetical protein
LLQKISHAKPAPSRTASAHCSRTALLTVKIRKQLNAKSRDKLNRKIVAGHRCRNDFKGICAGNLAYKWRILNVALVSEMNYVEKRLTVPTNRYFLLQSPRVFGFM